MKYVYGLDLAWSTGIAIYDLEKEKFVYVGSIDTKKLKQTAKEKRENILEHGKKLRRLSEELQKLFEEYPPSMVAIERSFSGSFKNAIIALAKVHGIVNEMLATTPSIYYPPKTIKEAIYKGDATKSEIQRIILSNFEYLVFENEDESDAVAICLTYLMKEKLVNFNKPVVEKKKKKTKKKKEKLE